MFATIGQPDFRTRFLGAKPVKLFKVLVQGQPAVRFFEASPAREYEWIISMLIL